MWLAQGVPGSAHPLSAGTAVHFLSREVGAPVQFPEVTLLRRIAEVQKAFSSSAKHFLLKETEHVSAHVKLFARHCRNLLT